MQHNEYNRQPAAASSHNTYHHPNIAISLIRILLVLGSAFAQLVASDMQYSAAIKLLVVGSCLLPRSLLLVAVLHDVAAGLLPVARLAGVRKTRAEAVLLADTTCNDHLVLLLLQYYTLIYQAKARKILLLVAISCNIQYEINL
jgi:hypothetical protein